VLEVRRDVATAYDNELQRRLATSVWTGCDSWYRTPGGRVVTNWPGSAREYRRRTATIDRADYRDPATGEREPVDARRGRAGVPKMASTARLWRRTVSAWSRSSW
jgi:hypothetical protein